MPYPDGYEDGPEVIYIMTNVMNLPEVTQGPALPREWRLSPARFAELRAYILERMRKAKLYANWDHFDQPICVFTIPVKIDERLPPSALGLHCHA